MTDKMRSFLKGLALGLAGKPLEFAPGKEPVAYLYGEDKVMLPKLPVLPMPYAVLHITYDRIYISQEPFVYGASCKSLLYCQLSADENGERYWSEWKEETSNNSVWHVRWTNHDIYKDGELWATKSEPTPVYPPVVLFDGESVTEEESYSDYAADTLIAEQGFVIGESYRITINGVSGEYTAERVATSGTIQIGNAGLNGNDPEAEDDGGAWLVVFPSDTSNTMYFYTRTAGTYQLKIERMS
jgi:hypothetical protein